MILRLGQPGSRNENRPSDDRGADRDHGARHIRLRDDRVVQSRANAGCPSGITIRSFVIGALAMGLATARIFSR